MFTLIKLAIGAAVGIAILNFGISAGEQLVSKACLASNIPHEPISS